MKKIILMVIGLGLAYFLFWPVPIDPVSWQAPENRGYVGAFQENSLLEQAEIIPTPEFHGPEAMAFRGGDIYASTREGWIIRHNTKTNSLAPWVQTGGSPLGIVFDHEGHLLVADAHRGLLRISPDQKVTVLADEVLGTPIDYADDVDIAADGKIYFSDASSKFGAERYGGAYQASLLDIMEHGAYGRLLIYDPKDASVRVAMSGLHFANGVAMSADSRFVLVVETGAYRIHKYWLKGEKAGQSEVLIDNLPGFPDNITRGEGGRFWVGLVSPRNQILDASSQSPFLRKILQRMPASLRPRVVPYSHVFAVDENGQVLTSLQDPDGRYHSTTGAIEAGGWLYVTSLHAEGLARLTKEQAGI